MLIAPIYMDYSATTPCDERVVQEMLPYFTQYFGNASSRAHSFGWQADAAVEQARERIAKLINAHTREIVFTSGATEACNLALRGVFELYAGKGNHIITTKIEHKAVLDTCEVLKKKGADITYLNVDVDGQIDLNELTTAIKPTTILVCVMFANNETGVVQPIKQIGTICKEHKVLFFCDATQAIGKVPVDVNECNIDLMSFSSHKIYGPKGAGALYIRSRNPRVKLTPQITGGGQENNVRSGTLNVSGIVGFGKACELCWMEMRKECEQLLVYRNRMETALLQLPQTFLNGHKQQRLPHILNLSFANLSSNLLIGALHKTLAISSGSACTSGSLVPSYVLTAMGVEADLAKAALRFSIGRFTNSEEIELAVMQMVNTVEELRSKAFIDK